VSTSRPTRAPRTRAGEAGEPVIGSENGAAGDAPLVCGVPWLVYMLRCRDGSLYTGVTTDLDRRLAAHRAGRGSRYTRSRLPVRLVYRERRPTRSAALRREAAIKRLDRAAKLRLLRPPVRT